MIIFIEIFDNELLLWNNFIYCRLEIFLKTFWYFSENNEGGKRRKNWYGYLIQTFSSFFFFSWRREARPQFGGASKHQVPVNFGWEQDRLLSIGNEFIGAALFFSPRYQQEWWIKISSFKSKNQKRHLKTWNKISIISLQTIYVNLKAPSFIIINQSFHLFYNHIFLEKKVDETVRFLFSSDKIRLEKRAMERGRRNKNKKKKKKVHLYGSSHRKKVH